MQTIKEITIPKLTVLKLIKCHVLVAEISNSGHEPYSFYTAYDKEKNIYKCIQVYSRNIKLTIEFDSYSFLEITE